MRIHKLNNGDTQRTIDNPWDVRAVHKLHGGGLLLIGINRYQQNEVFRWSITNLGSVPDFHSIRYSFKWAQWGHGAMAEFKSMIRRNKVRA